MKRAVAVLLLMIPSVVWGQGAPDTSRLPPVKPDAVTDVDGDVDALEVSKVPPDAERAPRSEASQDSKADTEEAAEDSATPPEPLAPPVWQTLQETDDAFVACLGALNELGAVYKVADPQTEEDRDCGIANPVRLSEPVPGVQIDSPALMRCETAVALGTWLRDFVKPAAATLKRGPVVTLAKGSGYQCRRRNNLPDGKLSEHAYGNAIDIMAFGFKDGSQIKVTPREREGSREESFQDAVRATACLYFSTVLGPGSDEAHNDHLHLDVIARDGGFRLCQ
ncbi:extensin family protein [Pseudosulfitobacter pseudonitzschiae]|uniref:extensin-like domain-containing protein n=2 Tax=Pseudosulfitobacter pseudonitzschiae TaxID=1402135 RepID=UPI001AFC3DB3|nr:extensin family protein [Pseudosulfitobacter pseudonitzschiae]MBM1814463.1 extensin family protein [Pseudosulfitobacter pseudonitzschiae]MBM1841169.1 extensin family protein [Pseudosulfitobacter pseudonitzschiae]MBM1850877.1 extensin family protein [Pseudosulfitobacter pseudonitzschiae]MBM1855715.1 extensin family protein [Pseudosulfitobacter pseudonitzschiae]MBM1860575.1 extensin family protein [Pseudosulfitobacter pseudonitzschiae]